jgi:hypothetical protein
MNPRTEHFKNTMIQLWTIAPAAPPGFAAPGRPAIRRAKGLLTAKVYRGNLVSHAGRRSPGFAL